MNHVGFCNQQGLILLGRALCPLWQTAEGKVCSSPGGASRGCRKSLILKYPQKRHVGHKIAELCQLEQHHTIQLIRLVTFSEKITWSWLQGSTSFNNWHLFLPGRLCIAGFSKVLPTTRHSYRSKKPYLPLTVF